MQVVSYNTFLKEKKKKRQLEVSVRYQVPNPTAALKTKRKGLTTNPASSPFSKKGNMKKVNLPCIKKIITLHPASLNLSALT